MNEKMYGKWLVMSRTGLKNWKHKGQASFANIYILNKFIQRTTETQKIITFAGYISSHLYHPSFQHSLQEYLFTGGAYSFQNTHY